MAVISFVLGIISKSQKFGFGLLLRWLLCCLKWRDRTSGVETCQGGFLAQKVHGLKQWRGDCRAGDSDTEGAVGLARLQLQILDKSLSKSRLDVRSVPLLYCL